LKILSSGSIKPVPENVDESNYKYLISDYRSECTGAIFAMVIMLIPAILILWAVFASYDPENSASGFIVVIFLIAGLIYVGTVLASAGKSISVCIENVELVKQRYKGPAIQEPKKNKWWLWLVITVVLLSVILLISKEPTNDIDTDYTPSYDSYTPSYNYSNATQKATKKINTTPALTKEEAERLRGTGYKGTRPNSEAESMKLKAAQVKCESCGMHSDNGFNSQCDACEYNEKYGLN